MKKAVASIVCLIALFSYGCANPELTRRYRSATWNKHQMPDDCVTVSAFVLDVSSVQSQAAILSLSPEGQAAFIEAVEKRAQNMNDFMEALGGTIGERPGDSGTIDSTVFRKRLVFTADKSPECPILTPADRISDLQVVLKINNAEFVSWDKFCTQYETVDLGKISLTQQAGSEIGANVGPQVGSAVPITVSPKVSYTRNLSEEVSLRQRYVVATGRLARSVAVLYLQGVVGIDLAGNFLVDVTFKVKASDEPQRVLEYSPLRKEGRPVEADKVLIRFANLYYPADSQAVKCSLEYLYTLRHVENNHKTIIEGDHDVDFITSKRRLPSDIEIIRGSELRTRIFGLATHKLSGRFSEDGWYLSLTGSQEAPIYFASYSAAGEFLQWMKETKSTSVAGYTFSIGERPIHPKEISDLFVKGVDLNLKTGRH